MNVHNTCGMVAVLGLLTAIPCHAEKLTAYGTDDQPKALSKLQSDAEQGNITAQKRLAGMYAIGEGVKEDDAQAIAWWTRAAQAGDAEAQWELGEQYTGGPRIKRDYPQAVVWYRKAAQQGYAPAQLNLASMLTGLYPPVPENRVEAAHWLQLAADQNQMGAASMLGGWYSAGIGVPHDDTQAVYWWRRAAESGRFEFNAEANLGESYELGRGVTRDYAQAFFWYQKATFMDPKAKQGLARLYERGLGTHKNTAEAVAIYTDLAKAGWQDAQRHLAGMYERGDGVAKDLVLACAWYTVLTTSKPAMSPDIRGLISRTAPAGTLEKLDKAFADDAQDAKENGARVAQQLTPEQFDRARKLALGWKPSQAIDDVMP